MQIRSGEVRILQGQGEALHHPADVAEAPPGPMEAPNSPVGPSYPLVNIQKTMENHHV